MTAKISRRVVIASSIGVLAAPWIMRRAYADDALVLRCSLDTVPAHARNGAIKDYLAKIEAATGGKIKTQIYESGQLFSDLQVGKALLQGQVEMGVPGTWTFTGIIPDADFFQLPALYSRSIDALHRVVDGKPGDLIATQVEQKLRSHVLGPWLDLGFFNWYSTNTPLTSYDSLKGLKIRNAGGAGQAWRTQFVSAIPNTTPLPNVSLGLSQGTFDGLITTNETVASFQFWESGIKHALEDHQFIGEYVPMVSLVFWEKLSPELKTIFTDTWRQNIGFYRANIAASQTRARDIMKSHGVTIVEPSLDAVNALRKKMIADQDQVAKLSRISSEAVSAVTEELNANG